MSVPVKLGLQNGVDILILDNSQHLEAALVPVFKIQRWEIVYFIVDSFYTSVRAVLGELRRKSLEGFL